MLELLVQELIEDDVALDSSSSSSSDEEDLDEEERIPRNSISNYMEDTFPRYSDKEFVTLFRMRKEHYNWLCGEYGQTLGRYCRLPANYQVAMFLWFAAHEACSSRDLGDRFNVSISTVTCVIRSIALFLSRRSSQYIRWPKPEQAAGTELSFREFNGFPGICGLIDGSHIKIDAPRSNKDAYIDRKGVYSVVLQGVCDENRRFIDVFVGFPGSVHDARVFRCSPLYEKLSSERSDFFLLGDSAYPCTPFLITPYRDNGRLCKAQKSFNLSLSSCRVRIEHAFGMLKQRFRQLYHCKLRDYATLCHFVVACCVLHNICGDLELDIELPEETNHAEEEGGEPRGTGHFRRDEICQHLASLRP